MPKTFEYMILLFNHDTSDWSWVKFTGQDFRVAKALLAEGWKEHDYERHWQPFSFPDSDGGVMFERNDPVPDHHLDQWHPLEKVSQVKWFAN